MISEPELEGEDGPLRPDREQERLPVPRERGPRRPWLWALGGAAVASAVWAGGLHASGATGEPRPVIAYRTPLNLCDDLKVRALSRTMGNLRGYWQRGEREHSAVDQARCTLETRDQEPPREKQVYERWSTVHATVELHKKTDPGPEFEADLAFEGWGFGNIRKEQVPGLGERALMITGDALNERRLRVLDGGAVFTMTALVNQTYRGESDSPPPEPEIDYTPIQSAMIEDMRELMAELRQA
ncbi:hypothetical protein GCM10020367_40970 [Streptomyces sannanensis]|uniref:DUF3558 domain-containing protein n=1 Tax=Streptomyces sannanensis TaxID=285536 RepID=A0ABP6SG03_9ACTN